MRSTPTTQTINENKKLEIKSSGFRWLAAVVLVGLAWRLLRWALAFPLWGDEVALALNLWDRGYRELLQPLDHLQVAPILFLWIMRLMMDLFGPGDLAVRLIPTLASLSALLLFTRLCLRYLKPLETILSTGFLAVAYYPVRHGAEVKPYSVDLLVSVIILSLVSAWLEKPGARGPIILLLVLTPVLVGLSFPAVFVLGGAAAVLIIDASRRKGLFALGWSMTLGVMLVLSFLAFYLLSVQGQNAQTGPGMRICWTTAFPPANPLKFLVWLIEVHAGNMLAYPIGGKNAGSTFTLLVAILGVTVFWRNGRRNAMVLLLLPFLLTLVAAAMHRYPYGTSARIAQHLAPAICLFAGSGTAWLLSRIPKRYPWRQYVPMAAIVVLIMVGVLGMLRDVRKPFKTPADLGVKETVHEALQECGAAPLYILSAPVSVPGNYLWYLKQQEGQVHFTPGLSFFPLKPEINRFGIMMFSEQPSSVSVFLETLKFGGSEWKVSRQEEKRLLIGPRELPPSYCRWIILHRR